MVFFLYFFSSVVQGHISLALTWPAWFWILAHYFHLCHDMIKKMGILLLVVDAEFNYKHYCSTEEQEDVFQTNCVAKWI